MRPRDEPQHLLRSLFAELYDSERSASVHCRREGDRLGDCPLGSVMRAIAAHALADLPRLQTLAVGRDVAIHQGPGVVGRLFTGFRELVTDHMLSAERSYRMTVLAVRHGVDLVRLLRALAEQVGDDDLRRFCDGWLATRVLLVEDAGHRVRWFAEHPTRAQAPSSGGARRVLRPVTST